MEALQHHPLFNDKQRQEYVTNSENGLCNLLSFSPLKEELFAFDPQKKRINVINLLAPNATQEKSSQEILCEPPLAFAVTKLLCNPSGKYLCAIGINQCAVTDISSRARSKFFSQNEPVTCNTFAIGSFFHSTHPSVTIMHVEWHPISSHHLAILSSDNTLRLYDISTSVDDPEQVFRLYSLPSTSTIAHLSTPVAPTSPFSSPYKHSPGTPYSKAGYTPGPKSPYPYSPYTPSTPAANWAAFTVYFVTDNGSIYYICPVVPYNCNLPLNPLLSLLDVVGERLERLKADEPSPLLEYYTVQYKWLEDITKSCDSDVLTENLSGLSLSIANSRRCKVRPPQTKPTLMWQGPMDTYLTIVVYRVGSKGLTCCVIQASMEKHNSTRKASDITCAYIVGKSQTEGEIDESSVTVLTRLFSDGVVEVLLGIEEVFPLWSKWDQLASILMELGTPRLIPYERMDLKLSVSGRQNVHLTPYIFIADPYTKSQLFVVHAAGVHFINFPWIEVLRRFLATQADISALPDLPSGKVSCVMNSATLSGHVAAPLGITVLDLGMSGNFLVMLSATYKCYVVNLARDIVLDFPPPLPSVSVDKRQALPSFESALKPLLDAKPNKMEVLASGSRASFDNPDKQSMHLLNQVVARLNKDYIMYIHNLHAQTQTRVNLIDTMLKQQSTHLEETRAKIQQQAEGIAHVHARLEAATNFHENLAKRIDLLLATINAQQQGLSQAEIV